MDNCCVFWSAFGCCAQRKARKNTFFCIFQDFLLSLHLFSLFKQKTKKPDWKKCFLQLLTAGWHPNAGLLPVGGTKCSSYNESLNAEFFTILTLFFIWKEEKICEKKKKHLKTAKNVIWPAFGSVKNPQAYQNTKQTTLNFQIVER